MYGILGEDKSDTLILAELVRRLAANPRLPVKQKGFGCAGDLCNKGSAKLRDWVQEGLRRFIVCHDADAPDPRPVEQRVRARVVRPAGVEDRCCIVVPVQAIEAWILADLACVVKVIPSWEAVRVDQPEGVRDPKGHIVRLSRQHGRARYDPPVHNPQIAKHLNLDVVSRRCPSFQPLAAFVRSDGAAA